MTTNAHGVSLQHIAALIADIVQIDNHIQITLSSDEIHEVLKNRDLHVYCIEDNLYRIEQYMISVTLIA